MDVDLDKISVVHWFNHIEKNKCGYCKKQEGSASNGMWAESLTVNDYQNLLDRGWRRSGKYCYKPIMPETCCPQYTIRCDALNFSISKSHKKIIKYLNNFVNKANLDTHVSTTIPSGSGSCTTTDDNNCEAAKGEDKFHIAKKCFKIPRSGVGMDPLKPRCQKAKKLRLDRKQQTWSSSTCKVETINNNVPKCLEDFLVLPDCRKLNLKIVLLQTRDVEDQSSVSIEFDVFQKYQLQVHEDPVEKITMKRFRRFLIATPLKFEAIDDNIGFGSYHQQYWLDDKLIAVGVLDILPKCVSSVYFFYDPDYRHLTLGTYGSLREIELTRQLQRKVKSIDQYYMGFYIHSCPKMRYKGNLKPSYLLCPETYRWIPIEQCLPKLDANRYSRLEDDSNNIDLDEANDTELEQMKLWISHAPCARLQYFSVYKRCLEDDTEFKLIAKLVGKKCINTMLYVIS